jgi:serpin B
VGLLKSSGPFETVFFSPASISACLGMVYVGAKGETKKELNEVVYGGLTDTKIFEEIKNVTQELSYLPTGYTFDVANRAYSTNDEELLDSFKQNLVEIFKSDIIKVDFKQSEPARQKINKWVKERTQEKISELLPAGSVNADTKLVLVNALYFKAHWMHKFPKNATKVSQFFSSENQHFNVSMMEAKNDEFHYARDKDVKILGIPFMNETMFMYFILPHKRFGLDQIEENLNGNRLLALFDKASKRDRVFVQVPKFKLEKELPLKEVLMKMNVTDMFARSADLSGLFGKKGLFVSKAFHQAVIEVNEEGSEAAAATAAVINKMAVVTPSSEFIADHPFLFAIVHRETNSILFFGRFANNKFK